MPQPYALDVVKLIDLTQNALSHAWTLQEMYEEGLPADRYDTLKAKYDAVSREKCEMLRSAVENPTAFAKAVVDFQRLDPKTKPH